LGKAYTYLRMLTIFLFLTIVAAKHCDIRGGCDCDCSWANSTTCVHDDGSCCWECCCGGIAPSPSTCSNLYCPSSSDLIAGYGSPQIHDQGWQVNGGGAVATKSAYNLLGGYVEYDIDFSRVHPGVNANIYTISPKFGNSSFDPATYCDGAATGAKWCPEVDWVESNGNCGGQTTLHTVAGPGSVGCTAWGCSASYHYGGKSSYHMRIEYGSDGTWTTIRDGQTISPSSLSPVPGANDWSVLTAHYSNYGAVIYSSQWVGWVPVPDCGSSGDLNSSSYSVSNLQICGKVVQGPSPRTCP